MQTGKERYEERRQQEHDNEMARLRMQKAHYNAEHDVRLFVAAMAAFVCGDAHIAISLGVTENKLTFVWPGKPTESAS